jgi:hypothetical protein
MSQVASVSASATSYADTAVSPATQYYYRVIAVSRDGSRAASSVVSVTTPSGVADVAVAADMGTASDMVDMACVPTTCSANGFSCGSTSDGCGGTLVCGTCASGQTCANNRCVAGTGARTGRS